MKKLLFVTCISVILLSSCEDLLAWLLSESGTKTFWAVDTTKNSGDRNYYYKVNAELLFENNLCKVYAETTSGVTEQVAKKMAAEYNVIYDKMIAAFGLEFDVEYTNGRDVEYTNGRKDRINTIKYADALTDGDGKLTILLLDIKDGYRKGVNESYVAGYFTPYNFFKDTNSNSCDMIYIDTNPALKENPEDAYSTLAHELQHLMNFTTTLQNRNETNAQGQIIDIYLMDTWIDEGLASAAEYIYTGKHLVDRWGWYYFNGNGNGLIDKGNNFFIWGNRDHDESCGRADRDYPNCKDPANHSQYALLDDYATVYLFFQWLRIQSSKDVGIYKDIIGYEVKPVDKEYYSNNSYVPVTEAAKTINPLYRDNWGLLLEHWLAANYIYNPNGPYGYKNDFDFKIDGTPVSIKGRHLQSTTAKNIYLYPGEGVYSKITSSFSKPSGIYESPSTRYSLLTSTDISTSNSISNGALLTYNANSANFIMVNKEKKDPSTPEQGTLTGVPASVNIADPVNGRSVASQFRITGPYRIGIGDVRRGGFRDLPPIDTLQLPNSLLLREE